VGGRLVLLAWSPRVAPGLLSWPAWEVLRAADAVHAADPDHPLTATLATAGIRVDPHDADPRALVARAAGSTVVWLLAEDGDPPLTSALQAGAPDGVAVEVLPASYDLPGARVLDLVRVMDRLRSPGGCPWDAEQTHASLVKYLLEEAYETVDAIEGGELVHLREELGDLLLQVVFHARIGQEHESDAWSLDDVAEGITAKLVRRHPHVFGDAEAGDAESLEQSWEQLKAAEKGRTSVVEGVAMGQPALSLAAKLHDRARRSDLPLPAQAAVSDDLDDEQVGAALLALVARARAAGVDPEAALRAASRRYAERLQEAERSSGA
jgi:XTP/dITP diphosphohydrolase